MLEDGLLHLNKVAEIFKTFLHPYYSSLLEVYAEVQVLDYFYKMQMAFAGADRFIACTRVMVHSSHRKIWTKWSPLCVQQFDDKNPAARQQKDILNKMTQDLREQVTTHVLQRLPSNRWHPDSNTNITDIREFGINSESLEVSGAETPETLSNAGTDLGEDSGSENGGVPLFNST
ncbi:hypothetical protein N7508_011098 [Penicillium antarcticum]|uniref:uncharacterized protein n=1 Tax=Penicillium antarcticum TaxID=416450 RepID=UPI00238DDAA0|nr:uncharacterized protein N7508_011098 [Penicillium antarcticum]KAJ5288323.1 hypothetical protein N7508_011098 [Penicillium antarcticum]